MDNATAKNILSANRRNGADATDPVFAAVLEQCAADPELHAWFEHERAFDARMAQTFAKVRAPEDAKEALLATAKLEPSSHPVFSRVARALLPLAALLVIAVGLVFTLRPGGVSWEPGEFQLGRLAASVRSLDHEADSPEALREWLRARGAPVPDALPELLATAQSYGCKIFDDGRGGKVSLFCFSVEGQSVHLFVFDEQTRELLDVPGEHWAREGRWNVRALRANGTQLAVATRGATETLNTLW